MADSQLPAHVDLLEQNFPGDAAPPGAKSLVLCTGLVATHAPEQQMEIVRAMRRSCCAIVDIQRLFMKRNNAEAEAAALSLVADAGSGPAQLFVDLGANGRYVLFTNDG